MKLRPSSRAAAAAVATLLTMSLVESGHSFPNRQVVPSLTKAAQWQHAKTAKYASANAAAAAAAAAAAQNTVAEPLTGSGTAQGRKGEKSGQEVGASIPNEVFNLVKSIMGAAIFTLPAGIATFANSPMGVIPAVGLLAFVALLSAYCFSLIGRVCSYTGATSYKDAWAKSVGQKSSWIPNLASLLTTMQALIAYSIVLSSTIPQLAATVGVTLSRTQALFSVTSFILLPLCLMKSLSALAPFSLVGLGGLVYTATAMLIRFFDGSYATGGIFFQQIEAINRPQFGTSVNILTPAVFILASRISTACMAHYQSAKLFRELKRPTIPRFQRMVAISYGIVFIMYALISSVGFLTFGEGSSNFIINNYSTKDTLISGSRLAIFLSLLFSYPLTFVGLRDSMMDAIWPKGKTDNKSVNICTLALLAFVTLVAYFVSDIGALLSFGGATYANWLTFLFPTVMFLNCAKRLPVLRKERPAVIGTMIVGLLMSAIGTGQFIANQLL